MLLILTPDRAIILLCTDPIVETEDSTGILSEMKTIVMSLRAVQTDSENGTQHHSLIFFISQQGNR